MTYEVRLKFVDDEDDDEDDDDDDDAKGITIARFFSKNRRA